jgi:predicted TIM-barrel fold metal-dependent hydrolase
MLVATCCWLRCWLRLDTSENPTIIAATNPLLTPDRWLADFATIAIKDEVRPLILKENAVRLFGLA